MLEVLQTFIQLKRRLKKTWQWAKMPHNKLPTWATLCVSDEHFLLTIKYYSLANFFTECLSSYACLKAMCRNVTLFLVWSWELLAEEGRRQKSMEEILVSCYLWRVTFMHLHLYRINAEQCFASCERSWEKVFKTIKNGVKKLWQKWK